VHKAVESLLRAQDSSSSARRGTALPIRRAPYHVPIVKQGAGSRYPSHSSTWNETSSLPLNDRRSHRVSKLKATSGPSSITSLDFATTEQSVSPPTPTAPMSELVLMPWVPSSTSVRPSQADIIRRPYTNSEITPLTDLPLSLPPSSPQHPIHPTSLLFEGSVTNILLSPPQAGPGSPIPTTAAEVHFHDDDDDQYDDANSSFKDFDNSHQQGAIIPSVVSAVHSDQGERMETQSYGALHGLLHDAVHIPLIPHSTTYITTEPEPMPWVAPSIPVQPSTADIVHGLSGTAEITPLTSLPLSLPPPFPHHSVHTSPSLPVEGSTSKVLPPVPEREPAQLEFAASQAKSSAPNYLSAPSTPLLLSLLLSPAAAVVVAGPTFEALPKPSASPPVVPSSSFICLPTPTPNLAAPFAVWPPPLLSNWHIDENNW
jgi:hypothetical protein